ncbi:hypothetical protein Scep_024039 [Stephania cephalantha]|uniref:Uncharacterized protein n=1 Tax=Stephania cephalantha TaxID=152367 RepID=A0AAP0EWG2_9MAGN
MEEEPNPQAQQLYDMIDTGNEQLWPGCVNVTKLSALARLFYVKSKHHISECCYDGFMLFIKEVLPNKITLVNNFNLTKQLMRGLDRHVEKINCWDMIYWGDDLE